MIARRFLLQSAVASAASLTLGVRAAGAASPRASRTRKSRSARRCLTVARYRLTASLVERKRRISG